MNLYLSVFGFDGSGSSEAADKYDVDGLMSSLLSRAMGE